MYFICKANYNITLPLYTGVGPFKAHFSNDTPIVSEGVVEAIFESNKLATGKCRLSTKGSTTKKKCK